MQVTLLQLITIHCLVVIEYLQNISIAFAASYIMGGISAAPEEFSLAAAAYASTAIFMVVQHQFWVERLGYRRFVRYSHIIYALGACLCALSNTPGEFIFARVIQGLGGATFFTAARLLVNHFCIGKERILGIRFFASGLLLGSSLAPLLGAWLVSNWGWQSLFWAMAPILAVSLTLCELTLPGKLDKSETRSSAHLGGLLCLVAGAIAIQYAQERSQYDLFSQPLHLWIIGLLGVAGVLAFIRIEWHRSQPLIAYQSLMNTRFAVGMGLYFLLFVVANANNYILPVFIEKGLGFDVPSAGWIISVTSLVGVPIMFFQTSALARFLPSLRVMLIATFGLLVLFAIGLSQVSEQGNLGALTLPLLAFSAFTSLGLGYAAQSSFSAVDPTAFSHAYQTKNVIRELANSGGISMATMVLQSRSTVHYARLTEQVNPYNPWYQPALDQLQQVLGSQGAAIAKLGAILSQQATFMACIDYFRLTVLIALAAMAMLWFQRVLK